MKEKLWRALAWFVSRKKVADWIIKRALRTPYTHILTKGRVVENSDTGLFQHKDLYMGRYWLFNHYPWPSGNSPRWKWLPSVRIHHIALPDNDRHMHDHPFDSRTIILKGWYEEETPSCYTSRTQPWLRSIVKHRAPGDTAPIRLGKYHRISSVSPGGAWTLFITWRYQGEWGYWVDGRKVNWREYHAELNGSDVV